MLPATGYRRFVGVLTIVTLLAGVVYQHLFSELGMDIAYGVVTVLVAIEVVRARVSPAVVPLGVWIFLALAAVSLAWSEWRGATALGLLLLAVTTLAGVFFAACFSWPELIDLLALAGRWILGLSLLFELFVSVVIREHILPLWVSYPDLDPIPNSYYWSRDLLFEGGRIQGILGNSNSLSLVAVVAAIAFAARLFAGRGSRPWGWFWLVVALGTLGLARSLTMIVALAAALAASVVALAMRRTAGRARIAVGVSAVVVAAGAVAAIAALRGPLLALAEKSDDLTHRTVIWGEIWRMIAERPAQGWGWTGWWAPWIDKLTQIATFDGVAYRGAHDVWLEVAMQLGVLGVIALLLIVVPAAVGAWRTALDRGSGLPGALAIAPVALITMLLVEGLAESRPLTDFGWAMLVVLAAQGSRPRTVT